MYYSLKLTVCSSVFLTCIWGSKKYCVSSGWCAPSDGHFSYTTKTELFSQTACHKAHIAPLTRVHAISQHQSWFPLVLKRAFSNPVQRKVRQKCGCDEGHRPLRLHFLPIATWVWQWAHRSSTIEFKGQTRPQCTGFFCTACTDDALLQVTCTFRDWPCFCSLRKISV